MVVYNELFTKLKELLFPDYIYYNTEQYYMDENGFIIRDSKMNDGKINYEIHDVIPQNVKAEIELIIKINNIDKEIMQKIISQLEMSKTFFQNRSSKGLLCLDNPNFNDRYNEYLIIVKDRQKQLINIYEELKLKYFPINKKI
ncbi:MAG TPA: hypothetical protein DCQ58_10320, partial [Saprospirales bacterium]|nr:hypothetical protein [Saprospirales bacterium]